MAKILTLIVISGCTKKMEFYDYTHLHDYSRELESAFLNKEKLDPPYTVLFNNRGNQLLYIATNHTIDPNSKTFQFINKAFKEYQPDFVIIEGIEEIHGESPQKLIQYIENECLKQNTCCEGLYAAHVATQNKVNFIGAEPSNQDLYSAMIAKNYTKKDCIFLHFIQQLPHYCREGKLKSEHDLPKLYCQWAQEWKCTEFSYSDFKNWYEKNMHFKISYKNLIDPEHTAPIKKGSYAQQLSATVSRMRNQYILSVIFKSMLKYKKILILYGHSHFPAQKDVLYQHLGNPQFFK